MIAWVVGASGAWGHAVSRDLLSRGYDVVALGRHNCPDLAAEAKRLKRKWSFARLDLAASDRVAAGVAARKAIKGAGAGIPDVLFLCAAVTGKDRETTVRSNYVVPASLIEQAAAVMTGHGGGRIGVFVAQNARLGMAGLGDYSAAQAALWTWCEAFRGELKTRHSRVTLTRVIPPRTASPTQQWVSERSGHKARLHPPKAQAIVSAVLAGKRRAGRRPVLAALSTLLH